jgi:acyl-CoA synthetase (AMP-forming)/AMP-acid ligase II
LVTLVNVLISDLVHRCASRHPERLALADDRTQLTFAGLSERITSTCAALDSAFDPGVPIAVTGMNSVEFAVLLYAIPASGRELVMINARWSTEEQERVARSAGAWPVFEASDLVDATPPGRVPPCESTEDTIAWRIHTSGTTGDAKAVPIRHRNLLASVAAARWGRPYADTDCYLFPFPLFHVAAYNVVHAHEAGVPVILVDKFDPGALCEAINRYSVTTVSLAPTMLHMWLESEHVAKVNTICYGAAPMTPTLLRRAAERLGCGFNQGYGMTEMAGNGCFLNAEEHRRALAGDEALLGCAGRPAPGLELRIDDGEILVRGPQVVDRYLGPNADQSSFSDGWFRTGDIGTFDGTYLTVTDRKKDLVITGGENVSAREVEAVLSAFDRVAQVAVIATPSERWGEAVTAVIVPRGEIEDLSVFTDEVRQFCRGRLSGFKIPQRVELVSALPVNASGKIDKVNLRQRFR